MNKDNQGKHAEMNENKTETLPLEPQDISKLEEVYGKNLIDAIGKAVSDIKFIVLFIFVLILISEIIIFIANFNEINEKTGEERISMLVDLGAVLLFMTGLLSVFFLLIIGLKSIKSYAAMRTAVARNEKRRIIGRASIESIMEEGGYSDYWTVQTDGEGVYSFYLDKLNCKDGDIAQVEFVTVEGRNVVLASKSI